MSYSAFTLLMMLCLLCINAPIVALWVYSLWETILVKREGKKTQGYVLQLRKIHAGVGKWLPFASIRYTAGEREYTREFSLSFNRYAQWKKHSPGEVEVIWLASHPRKAYLSPSSPLIKLGLLSLGLVVIVSFTVYGCVLLSTLQP